MAASMRVVNVRNKCASISLRCFLSRNRQIILSSFSHNSTPDFNPVEHEKDEGDDFFGISANLKFKLQQVRPATSGEQEKKKNSESLTSVTEVRHANTFTTPGTDSRWTPRERRKVAHTSFSTTFGSITLDRAVIDQMPNDVCTKDVALKAQEILTKLNRVNNESTATSTSDKTEKQINKHSKEKISKRNSTINVQTAKEVDQDSSKASRHRTTTNYFDEVYFPEHSMGQDSSTYKQASARRPKRHVPDSTGDTTSNHHSVPFNSVSHSSVSEVNDISEPNISRYTSVHDEHRKYPKPHSVNLVDEQYFGAALTQSSGTAEHVRSNDTDDPVPMQDEFSQIKHKDRRDVESEEPLAKEAVDFNDIDLQYFGTTSQNLSVCESGNHRERVTVDTRTNSSLLNVVEDYIDPLNLKQSNKESSQINEKDRIKRVKKSVDGAGQKNPATERRSKAHTSNKQEDNANIHHPHLNMNAEPSSAAVKDQKKYAPIDHQQQEPTADSNIITNEEFLKMRKTKNTKAETQTVADKPETAYDVAMKIRNKLQRGIQVEDAPSHKVDGSSHATEENMQTDSNIKLDSKGFRVLDNQVPDLNKMTSADLVRMLKKRIIFNHEDFLAIDKPYGLPCYSQVHDRVSVTGLLPAFTELLPQSYNAKELHLVQGLDRDVTGAIILAKTPEVAFLLRGMYKDSDLVTQRFWAVTKGVPTPPAGVIDIPVGEAKVGNIYKMVLRPRFMKEEKFVGRTSKAASERAITQYTVLSSYLQSALVECTLLTNVKHQIRLHLASGLGTPILGDHKYSNFAKLAPQKLHKEMLELLKIRQATVRHLAIHLHCRSIILKDYKGRMIFLTTYPPSHFRDNMRNLRIPKIKQ